MREGSEGGIKYIVRGQIYEMREVQMCVCVCVCVCVCGAAGVE